MWRGRGRYFPRATLDLARAFLHGDKGAGA